MPESSLNRFSIGTKVYVKDLKSFAHLNGRAGTVATDLLDNGRYGVDLDDPYHVNPGSFETSRKRLAVKPANIVPLRPDQVDRYGRQRQAQTVKFKNDFTFEFDFERGRKFLPMEESWKAHVDDIIKRDPSTATDTVSVQMFVYDASDFFRRPDHSMGRNTLAIYPCKASFLSIGSHPHGEWGFKNYSYTSAEETILKRVPPWRCCECESDDTQYSSLSCTHAIMKGGDHDEMLVTIFRMPSCFQHMETVYKEKVPVFESTMKKLIDQEIR